MIKMAIENKKQRELSAQSWRGLRDGFKTAREFIIEFPPGIQSLVDGIKESATAQIKLSIAGVLSPLINQIDQTAADITKDLGINDAMNTIQNSTLELINGIAGLISTITSMDTESWKAVGKKAETFLYLLNEAWLSPQNKSAWASIWKGLTWIVEEFKSGRVEDALKTADDAIMTFFAALFSGFQ